MKPSRIMGPAALVIAAFTAACGGGDGGSGPSFPDSVSTADAEDFADGVANYANYVADAMNFGGPSIALSAQSTASRIQDVQAHMGVRAPAGVAALHPDLSMLNWRSAVARANGPQLAAGAGCSMTVRGATNPGSTEPLDLNGNDIPDDFFIRIDCELSDTAAVDSVLTVKIIEEIVFKEITSSFYGQTVSYVIFQGVSDNHGHHYSQSVSINGKQDIRADGIIDQAAFKVRNESDFGGGPLEFEEAGESWDNAFDPASAISLGSDIPDGDLTIGGHRYYANSDGDNLSFGIHTTDPLAYSAACALAATNPPFSDGTLVGNLNNSSSQASFTIDFTSCGNYTIAVNGAYDEPVVVSNHP